MWVEVTCSIAFGGFIYYAWKSYKGDQRRKIQGIATRKRLIRESEFQKVVQELSEVGDEQKAKWLRITESTFAQLRSDLQNEIVSAADAVDAYRWKAMECQEKYNCVVEFIKEAPLWARNLDEEYKGKPKPSLFGMPFGVKENICVIGYDASRGYAKDMLKPMTQQSTSVTQLRGQGAVPIVLTNIPQGLLSFMCSNPVFGTTLNPHDIQRTTGGSTGGGACIVAAGGCPFSIGGDLGGSMRIPAHFCGITTLRTTAKRTISYGQRPIWAGLGKLSGGHSFFTKDTADQIVLLQSMWSPEYWKLVPRSAPVPFREIAEPSQLRIGYYSDNGFFAATPACERAVLEAKRILESLGHQLVPVSIPDSERLVRLIPKVLLPDNGERWLLEIDNEAIDRYLTATKSMMSMPLPVRWLASKMLLPFDRKAAAAMGGFVNGLDDLLATFAEADAYASDFLAYWRETKLDAAIGVVMPFPALHHECPTKLSYAVLGTSIYNLLDFPAGVVRVTTVSEEDVAKLKDYPKAESEIGFWKNSQYDIIRKSLEGSAGLPVGVQVISLPYHDELCLKLMQMIENGRDKV